MLDGLGLVNRGQEGTGAAALVNPKVSNVKDIAEQIAAQNKSIAAAKAKNQEGIIQDINEVKLGDWDVKTQVELINERDNLVKFAAEAFRKGGNPKDITTPEGQAYYKLKTNVETKVGKHADQKKAYIHAVDMFQKENEKAVLEGRDPVYNLEHTLKNFDAYANSESIDGRSKIDPNSLLVVNEVPFVPYDIFTTLKGKQQAGSNDDPTKTTSYSTNEISKQRAVDYIKTQEGAKMYEKGKKAGYWADEKSFYNWAKNNDPDASTDYRTTTKAPKASVSGGISEEERAAVGEPGVDMKLNVSDQYIGTSGKTNIKTAEMPYHYAVPNINVTIPNVELTLQENGEKYNEGTGVSAIVDGTLAVGLSDKNGNLIPINKNSRAYSFKGPDGKMIKIKANSKEELVEQMVIQGAASYDVYLIGQTKEKYPSSVYTKASNAITNDGSTNLGKANTSYKILQRKAQDLNTGWAKPTTTGAEAMESIIFQPGQ